MRIAFYGAQKGLKHRAEKRGADKRKTPRSISFGRFVFYISLLFTAELSAITAPGKKV